MSLNKNIFYTLLTQLPTSLFGFLTGVFITRMLGPGGRGVYTLFQANIELFTLFFGLSTNSAIVYYVAGGKIGLERIVGIGIVSLAVSTVFLFGALGAILCLPDTSWVLPPHHDSAFYVAYLVIGYVVGLANAYISAIFQGKSLFKLVNLAAICNGCFNLIMFGSLFVYSLESATPIDVRTVLSLSMAIFSLNSLLWVYFYCTKIGVMPSFSFSFRDDVRPLFSFGLLLHLVYAINFLNYRLDVWIVNFYKGADQLGFYSLSANISQMLWLISAPIAAVLSPHLTSEEDAEEKREQFMFFSRLNCTCALGAVLVALACGDWLIPRVYGAPFATSVGPFKLLMVGTFFGALTKVFAVYTVAKGHAGFNLFAVSAGLIVTVVLDFALIPKFGIMGASMATTLSYAAILACILFALFHQLRIPMGNYFILTPADLKVVSRKILIASGVA